MEYNHEKYTEAYAEEKNLGFFVASSWKSMLSQIQISCGGGETYLVADYDESSTFSSNQDDALLEYRTYSVYFFTKVETGSYNVVPKAKHKARQLADAFVRRMLRDSSQGRNGLRNLLFESISISTLGMVADWKFGVLLTFTIVGGFEYVQE